MLDLTAPGDDPSLPLLALVLAGSPWAPWLVDASL